MNIATQGGNYTIGKGDTLSRIAARHGVSVEDLAKANDIRDPNRIRAGQTLTIPGQEAPFPSPQEIVERMLSGKVAPVTGTTATPLPTASEWPRAEPGTGNGPMPEQKPSEPSADPKMAAMVEMAGQPVDSPGKAALLKPVETLTQSEMTDMINSAQGDYRGWRSGDPLKAHTYEKVQDWHVAMYGDGPQANDGGKPVDPTPIRAIPDQPSPHVTPQGEDLWQATGRLGGKVAEAAGTDGADNAVKSLQRGLNMLNDAKPLPARSTAYAPYTKLAPVAEDGAYGPQTDFALKHATARLGAGKVEEAFALGRFNTFAREAQRSGNAEGLEAKTHAAFGPLFRDPADTQAPKLEGGALQETLNTLGPRGQGDWMPLKVDNWIGPKTTEAFGKVLQREDADGITAAVGRRLGFL
ncbi:LysM peptidoglycan-binding domain-containing protein [Magnetospirillum aberrantis SpK]|uniref:LysM peptidoglycan-binding domain-containing protein n=2 Tax=Magnetospirillum TaxID=13134 RepID=A0A7C9V0W8_9PROT|nr:LysM peptidoglycan-binding domain-containing protein [Magnetospirillum aberrantis SpK]